MMLTQVPLTKISNNVHRLKIGDLTLRERRIQTLITYLYKVLGIEVPLLFL